MPVPVWVFHMHFYILFSLSFEGNKQHLRGLRIQSAGLFQAAALRAGSDSSSSPLEFHCNLQRLFSVFLQPTTLVTKKLRKVSGELHAGAQTRLHAPPCLKSSLRDTSPVNNRGPNPHSKGSLRVSVLSRCAYTKTVRNWLANNCSLTAATRA